MRIGDALSVLLDGIWQIYVASYLSIFLHELGHLVAACIGGHRATELRVGARPLIGIQFKKFRLLLGTEPISGRASVTPLIRTSLKFDEQNGRVRILSVPWAEEDSRLRPNDEILSIDGALVSSESDFTTLLNKASGRLAQIAVLRAGAERTIEWRLPPMKAETCGPHSDNDMPQVTWVDKFHNWIGRNERLPAAIYTLAGPLTSLLLAGVFYYTTVRYQPHPFTLFATILNVQIGVIALLPWVPGSDGNELVRELTGWDLSTNRNLRVSAIAFTNIGFLLEPVIWFACWRACYQS